MLRFTNGLVVALVFSTLALAQSPIPNTPQGFQQQYHPVFESFQHHNHPELQSRLDAFAMPAHWFADTFGPDHGPELAAQYAAEFAGFKRRTADSLGAIDAVKARLQIDLGTPVDIRTRRWTPAEDTTSMQRLPGLSAPLPLVQKFQIAYMLAAPGQSGRLTAWLDSFLYIDGAFRYFGHANKPFWSSAAAGPKPAP